MTVRLDKWLWAARFFKTRTLASVAIKAGKISINGFPIKPGYSVAVNDVLSIHRRNEIKTVTVCKLSMQRGPANIAQQLYEETVESKQRREKEKQLRHLSAAQRPRGAGRPTKRERRLIHRFTDPD